MKSKSNRNIMKWLASPLVGLLAFCLAFLPLGTAFSALVLCCAIYLLGITLGAVSVGVFSVLLVVILGQAALPHIAGGIVSAIILYYAVGANAYFRAGSLASLGMLTGFMCYTALDYYVNARNWMSDALYLFKDTFEWLRVNYPPGAENYGAVMDMLDMYDSFIGYVYRTSLPMLYVTFAVTCGFAALAIARGVCKKTLKLRQPFSLFTVPRYIGVMLIAAILLSYVINESQPQMLSFTMCAQALFMAAFTVQGLAVLAFYLRYKKLPPAAQKTLIALGLFLMAMPMFSSAFVIVGVVEMMFHFRERLFGANPGA